MTNPMRHIRKLTIALIISGAFNIALVAMFYYWMVKERPPMPYYELKPASKQEQQSPLAIDHSNNEVIRYFRKMSAEWLVTRLNNTQLVENGYTQRDLALASLVAFHHFDLERAFAGLSRPDQKRSIIYGKFRNGAPAELTVYPGLSEKHFEAVVAFAAMERWPLTSRGIFTLLKKERDNKHDHSLEDAFTMTPEFMAVELLFSRGEVAVDKPMLLNVILQAEWSTLESFVQQQKSTQDLSLARRQRFLLDYIQHKSKAAAYLILKTDMDFAANKLDDNHVMMILDLIEEKTPEGEKFATAILTSPRSDAVGKIAANRLYSYAGEVPPEKNLYHAALARFVPGYKIIKAAEPIPMPAPSKQLPSLTPTKLPPVKQVIVTTPPLTPPSPRKPVPALQQDRLYIVQDGDSLWKISRKFNVDMDLLRSHNKLETDTLRPGKPLRIPY